MKKNILIVDDDALIRYSLSRALSRMGLEVKSVESGEQALHEIESSVYDLCFIDFNLPGLNGIDVMKRVKEARPDTMVFIMTGSYINGNMIEALEDGADYFITKPFNISQISTVIKDLLFKEGDTSIRYRPTGSGPALERRRCKRKPLLEPVACTVSIIPNDDKGGNGFDLMGEIVDLSEQGIGGRFDFPLKTGYRLRFTGGVDEREGIVRWSMPLGDQSRYRAGVQLI